MPTWLIAAISTCTPLLIGLVAWVKVRPEVKKMRAEQEAVLVSAANGFTSNIAGRLDAVWDRLDEVESRERQRDELLRRHTLWDDHVVRMLRESGLDVSEPPPLSLPATG